MPGAPKVRKYGTFKMAYVRERGGGHMCDRDNYDVRPGSKKYTDWFLS
jgi:hypothetical protein